MVPKDGREGGVGVILFLWWWLSTMLGIIVEHIVEWLPFAVWLWFG